MEQYDPRVMLPDGTPGYAINNGGYIDIMVRATSTEVFQAAALQQSLLQQFTDADGVVTVGNTPHVHISGPMYPEITPAEWGVDLQTGEPTLITAAVLDSRPHYNIRIAPWAQAATADDGVTPKWMATLMLWMQQGQTDASNRNEQAVALNGVSVIDPTTVQTPQRVWA